MLHLVVYDIASAKRLRKVARACEDYGVRVEKSVFECELTDAQFAEFWGQIVSVVNEDVDSVIDYPIGLLDRGKIRTIGGMVHNEVQETYVF